MKKEKFDKSGESHVRNWIRIIGLVVIFVLTVVKIDWIDKNSMNNEELKQSVGQTNHNPALIEGEIPEDSLLTENTDKQSATDGIYPDSDENTVSDGSKVIDEETTREQPVEEPKYDPGYIDKVSDPKALEEDILPSTGNSPQAIPEESEPDVNENYCRVEGSKILDASGSVLRLKGMSFGNNVWYNPKTSIVNHHDEKSYAELNELGFNSVRFYLNYALFEDDSRPYAYKEEGFKWIEQNVEWAKKHGIKLILNMHIPQGGFISTKNVVFWNDISLQERYQALWEAIAERFVNEPAIIGYGLLNEPYLPDIGNADQTLESYYGFIQATAERIRRIDSNHILLIERPYGVVNSSNGSVTYPWGDTGSFRVIDDKNTVYEYHFYDEYSYTSQGVSYVTSFRKWIYSDAARVILSGNRKQLEAFDLGKFDVRSSNWRSVESGLTAYSGDGNAGYWFIDLESSDQDNTAYIDHISIKEYDPKGQYTGDIYQYDFDGVTYSDGWDMGSEGGGAYKYQNNEGFPSLGAASVVNFDKKYRLYISYNINNIFRLKKGYSYKMALNVKSSKGVTIRLAIQPFAVDKLYIMDKEYIDYKISKFREWGSANNVPMYLGEFGISQHMFGTELLGERWVADTFQVLNQYAVNYNYHDYHDNNYGLYIEDGREIRQQKNQLLYQIFQDYVN